MVKGWGPGLGTPQPYEPIGPWIDGIIISMPGAGGPDWVAMKAAAIDIMDRPLTPAEAGDFPGLCVAAPDAPGGIPPCAAGMAPISTQIVPLGVGGSVYAFRVVHGDADPVLNGLRWEGYVNDVGAGPLNKWTWLNLHLNGAPLHSPVDPVFVKWGVSVAPPFPFVSPIDGAAVGRVAAGLTYDTLNIHVSDVLGAAGTYPWAASLPSVTTIAGGAMFPNMVVCVPDPPATMCSVLHYELRSDLTFSESLDGTIAALAVAPADPQFSILLARDSPTSTIAAGYASVQDVVVTGAFTFDVYEKNAAAANREIIGATPIVSVFHWCVAAGFAVCAPPWGAGFPDAGVDVFSSAAGAHVPGAPIGVDLGSNAFVYDSQLSFPGGAPGGPVVLRTRQTPGLPLPAPYVAPAPADAYFTAPLGGTSGGVAIGGWHKFHHAGNINWWCSPCAALVSEMGPLPQPDLAVNIVDLATVAAHFGAAPGLVGPYGHVPYDLSGPAGKPDGKIDIFDLTRVALHFGESFLGGTDTGGGAVGKIPAWVAAPIPI